MTNFEIPISEMPTVELPTVQLINYNFPVDAPPEQNVGGLFKWLAALQVLAIFGGAAMSLFIAPASIFVSNTEEQIVGWMLFGAFGVLLAALGLLLIPVSLVAARGVRKNARWGKIVGVIAAVLALVEFPLGTFWGGYVLWKLLRRTER